MRKGLKLFRANRRAVRLLSPKSRLKTASSALALTLSNVFRTVSILLVTIFLGRALGPSEVGEFSVLLAAVAILQSVSIGGLSGAAVHQLLTDKEETGRATEVIVAARLILIPVIYTIGFFLIVGVARPQANEWFALFVLVAGYAVCTFDVPELIWTSRGIFTVVASRRAALVFLIGVPKIIAATSGNFSAVLILQGMEAALWQLSLLYGSGMRWNLLLVGRDRFRAGLQQLIELRNLWLSAIASALAMRSDIFVVTAILGSAAAGQYATASRFVEAATILAVAMTTVLFNPLVRSSNKVESYRRQSVAAARTILGVAVLITIFLMAAGPFLIRFLYGPDFAIAASIIAVYALTIVPIFQRQLISKFLIIERAYGYSLVSNIANLVFNVVINLVLLHLIGIWGAVFAALASYIISTYGIFALRQSGRDILIISVGSVFMGNSLMAPAIERSVSSRKVRNDA